MNEAKSRFFANFEREMADENMMMSERSTTNNNNNSNLDIDFSVTESGRTVAHMVTETHRSTDDTALTMDISVTQSNRSLEDFTESERGVLVDAMFGTAQPSSRSANSVGFTESERGVILEAFGPQSNRSTAGGAASTGTLQSNSRDIGAMELTESDRGVLLEAFGPESSTLDHDSDQDEDENNNKRDGSDLKKDNGNQSLSATLPHGSNAVTSNLPPMVVGIVHDEKKVDLASTPTAVQKIPQPPPQHNSQQQQQPQQPCSYGSSGSAFLSSVLNPHPNMGGHPHGVSHTPPVASSFEVAHFGKRPRSGSVSGKLRSASDYLEEKGLLDRQTKGILNDLFIIGDEEMQRALDRYEAGDPSILEEMIQSGALQHRLPKDLDILGELDFDFLTVDDNVTHQQPQQHMGAIHPQQIGATDNFSGQGSQSLSQPIPMQPQHGTTGARKLMHQHYGLGQQHQPSKTTTASSPHQHHYPQHYDDDGIGELDFAGDFVSDQTHFNLQHHLNSSGHHPNPHHHHHHLNPPHPSYADPTAAGSPAEVHQMTEYERRNRSNSLFSALINDPRQQPQPLNATQYAASGIVGSDAHSHGTTNSTPTALLQYGHWVQQISPHHHGGVSPHHPNAQNAPTATAPSMVGTGIQIAGRKPLMATTQTTTPTASGITTSLEADKKKKEKQKHEPKKMDKKKSESKKLQSQSSKKKDQQQQQKDEDDEHVTGCGRPHSPTDSNLFKTSKDSHGLMQVERPDGWVGAYSPESRKARLERFMEKRKHRVWTQGVKYDVRKNFAESRLRVKGRFVKKEDELLMRELMSIT